MKCPEACISLMLGIRSATRPCTLNFIIWNSQDILLLLLWSVLLVFAASKEESVTISSEEWAVEELGFVQKRKEISKQYRKHLNQRELHLTRNTVFLKFSHIQFIFLWELRKMYLSIIKELKKFKKFKNNFCKAKFNEEP